MKEYKKFAHDIYFFSHGAGQDSTMENYRIILDPVHRLRVYGKAKIVMVCCDTQDEHDYTYSHIEVLKKLNKDNNIEFYHLTYDMGFHQPSENGLGKGFSDNDSIQFKDGGKKSCTDKLKIKPFYRFMNAYLRKELGHTDKLVYDKKADRSKPAIKEYAKLNGLVRVFIGFSGGEEKRAEKTIKYNKTTAPHWRRDSVHFVFPLIEDNLKRKDLISYMDASPYPTPFPSNCKMCPFQSDHELLYNWRTQTNDMVKWMRYERRKLAKDVRRFGAAKNCALSTTLTIAAKLKKIKAKIGHMTTIELREYKFTHGHCIKGGF